MQRKSSPRAPLAFATLVALAVIALCALCATLLLSSCTSPTSTAGTKGDQEQSAPDTMEALLGGDFSPIAGTYAPVDELEAAYAYDFPNIAVDAHGVVAGGVKSVTYASAQPRSVVLAEDGSYECWLGEFEGTYQFYVVYPVGVKSNVGNADHVRIVFYHIDRGVLYMVYEQIEQ